MKRSVTALLVALCMGAMPALAQEADDWEFEQDPARNLSVAAARYEGGTAVIVQCQAGAFTAALVGLPPTTEELVLNASRADGRRDIQAWRPMGGDGVFLSTLAPRDVRFLRGGGGYTVRSAEGRRPAFRADFDLPPGSANLDRVLSACGWPVVDDRDQLRRVADDEIAFNRPGSRAARESERAMAEAALTPRPPAAAENYISCIVRDLRLRDCRADHQLTFTGPGSETARAIEGTRIYADDQASVEGGVVYLNLKVVVDHIAVP